jgi:hypothetical protein
MPQSCGPLWLFDACEGWIATAEKEYADAKSAIPNGEEKLRASLKLSEPRQKFMSTWERCGPWTHIAARDGALQIYHFGKSMEKIKDTLHSCPVLNSYVNRQELRSSTKLFTSSFRRNEKIRHAIGHTAELVYSEKTFEEQAVKNYSDSAIQAENSGIVMQGNLYGREYKTTLDGKVYSYEISDATHQKLLSVAQHFCNAFQDASQATINAFGSVPPKILEPLVRE